jgi:hypothetical protein
MSRRLASALLAILIASAVFAKSRHCTMRVHLQANPRDGSVFASPVTTPISGKNIFIEKVPALSEHDVAAFRLYRAEDASFGALLQLNDHGRLALDTLSVEHRGELLVVFLNGRAVTEMLIDRRVNDGRLYLPSGLTTADIALMSKEWPQIGAEEKK